jgi:hypothetical protein
MNDYTSQMDEKHLIAGYELTQKIIELYKLALEREDQEVKDLTASIAWLLSYDGAILPADDTIVSDIGDQIAGLVKLDREIENAKNKIKKIHDDRYERTRNDNPDVYKKIDDSLS